MVGKSWQKLPFTTKGIPVTLCRIGNASIYNCITLLVVQQPKEPLKLPEPELHELLYQQ